MIGAPVQELLDDVDRDGSGECEYPEFVEIMTISLSRIREQQEKSGEKQGPDISFDLMATAYRRKRLMEGLMSGDRDVQVYTQILKTAEFWNHTVRKFRQNSIYILLGTVCGLSLFMQHTVRRIKS